MDIHSMKNKVIQGDCLEIIKHIDDSSIDAIVTDPPYELGFMGKKWDSTGIAYNVELWSECLRVLKPGGHLLAFGGTRTYHRMAVAIEDAGFEVRDMLEWIYASGFPKSLNIGKAVDKLQGNERKVVGTEKINIGIQSGSMHSGRSVNVIERDKTKGNSEWEGFGTALKPAHEPIIMARKPLSEKTIVENVLKHGTGAIDIDGCRIPTREKSQSKGAKETSNTYGKISVEAEKDKCPMELGRFPANIICTDDALNDGEITKSGKFGNPTCGFHDSLGRNRKERTDGSTGHNDSGSKSRYFDIDVWAEKHGLLQFPKASKKDRGNGNTHATVKPTHLITWLIKLISKENDIILDPFIGGGTTAIASLNINRNFIGIEKEENHCIIAYNRIKDWSDGRNG